MSTTGYNDFITLSKRLLHITDVIFVGNSGHLVHTLYVDEYACVLGYFPNCIIICNKPLPVGYIGIGPPGMVIKRKTLNFGHKIGLGLIGCVSLCGLTIEKKLRDFCLFIKKLFS
jgi:hypothetical protein